MYFSDNITLRKLLSLVCVLCLIATMFAGCKKKDDTSSSTPSTNPSINLNLSDPTQSSQTESQPADTEPVINENTATVISNLNIRSQPTTESTVVGTLYAGDRVEVSRREVITGVDWAYIISPTAGWIVMDYVKMDIDPDTPAGNDTSTPAGNNSPTTATQPQDTTTNTSNTTNIKGVVTGNQLNIRSEPSTDGKVQGSYSKGDVVTILETQNGWGRTNKGWIKLDYVNTSGATNNTTTNNNTTTTTNTTTNNITGNGSTTVQFKGIVTAKQLNVRSSASTEGDRVGSLSYGARVEILEKDGTWGRTKDGWISLNYINQDGTTGTNTASGTVTGTQLNIRSGPGTGYASVGSYDQGDVVSILEQFTYNGVTWGCTSKGWISLDYVELDGVSVGSDQTGTITADGLHIRSGPGTGYASVGSLNSGDRVTIYKQTTSGDTTWGNIDKGWICMDYVDLD